MTSIPDVVEEAQYLLKRLQEGCTSTGGTAVADIDILPEQWTVVSDILYRRVPHYEAWAFGSRARKKAKPYSDLDLAIITDLALPPDIGAALQDELSEFDSPWKVVVSFFSPSLCPYATKGQLWRFWAQCDAQKSDKNDDMGQDGSRTIIYRTR